MAGSGLYPYAICLEKKGVSMKKLKNIPTFKSDEEEAEFWDTHDTTDYIDWSKAERVVFTNLKPSTQSISLRLPISLLSDLKVLANKNDVPYQSLMKVYLSERVEKEQDFLLIATSTKCKRTSESLLKY